jgi:hypothetical protein
LDLADDVDRPEPDPRRDVRRRRRRPAEAPVLGTRRQPQLEADGDQGGMLHRLEDAKPGVQRDVPDAHHVR